MQIIQYYIQTQYCILKLLGWVENGFTFKEAFIETRIGPNMDL